MARAVGIDLGTSNSCVAVMNDGNVQVLANAYGETTSASVVAFGEDGSVCVGNAARANVIHDPEHTISSAKRLIGRYFFSEEVKKAQAVCAYEIIEGPNHGVRIQVRDQVYSLPEISAFVLREMRQIAEANLEDEAPQAVITVPAYFNDNQRQATKDAGKIAGLEVLRILNEPTAAALAYGFGKGLDQRVAVYDLGGGTFDISILEIGKDIFEVLATCGDTFLGGDDFDDRIIDLIADEFVAREGINIRNDPYAFEKLKVAAEAAKRGLSLEDEVEIRIPDVLVGEDGESRSIERTITAVEFNSLVMDLIMRTFKVCDEALQQADLTVGHLDGVILVGGPTRLPVIRQAVSDYFQQDPRADVDPDEVVAMGAAIHANALVTEGAESFLLDVTPLDLRIGVAGDMAEPIIERNTPVPIEQTRSFTTFSDFQESVEIRVYQGDSREAAENELLGQFAFSGFKKARRGEVTIDVTFEINADGIVNVRALDPETGAETATRITLSSGLSDEELESILAEDPAARLVVAENEAGPSDAGAQELEAEVLEADVLETDELETAELETDDLETDDLETDDLETAELETDDLDLEGVPAGVTDEMMTGHVLEPVGDDVSDLELLGDDEELPTAVPIATVETEVSFDDADLTDALEAVDLTEEDLEVSDLEHPEIEDDVVDLADLDALETEPAAEPAGADDLFDRDNQDLSAGLDDETR